ncbi:MAG: hypothetical protein SFX73_16230 [Kofleriaceae bacterium]|nr:hypothetical protein [Kofleriaceae bacterium]
MRFAGILMVFSVGAGCGDDGGGNSPVDAAPADTAIDSAPQPVTVTAKDRGTGVANLAVVFHDPTGALLGQTTTDASGNATLAMPAGGMVTVIDDREGGELKPMTVGGVEPGDALTFTLYELKPAGTPTTSATLSIPTIPNVAGFQFNTGCEGISTGSGSSSIPANITTRCLDAAEKFHVLGMAHANGQPRAWTLLADQPKTTTSATFPAWNETLETVSLFLEGIPADTESMSLSLRVRIGGTPRYWHGADVSGASGTASILAPPGVGDARLWYGEAHLPIANGFDPQFGILAVTSPTVANASFDFATSPLPRADAIGIDLTGAPKLTWSVTGAAGSTDRIVLSLQADQGPRDIEWLISLPPDAVSPFTLPALPGDLASILPTANDDPYPFMMLVDVENMDSTQVRADAMRWARRAIEGSPDDAAPFRMRTSSVQIFSN